MISRLFPNDARPLLQGEALWPGKSDVDQLYLIRKNEIDIHTWLCSDTEFFTELI